MYENKKSLDLINDNEDKKENENNNEKNDDNSDDDDDNIENLGKNTNKKNITNSENNNPNQNKKETNINNFNTQDNLYSNKKEEPLLENVNEINGLINSEEYDENFENLNSQQDNVIKYGAIITTFLCIISMFLPIIIRYEDQFLTLQKNKGENTIFINIYIVYFYIFLLVICNCLLILFLTYENMDKNLRRILYKNLRWFFILTQGFLGVLFFTGIWGRNDWSLLSNIFLSMTIIILLAFYYDDIKIRKDMSLDTLISVFIYTSLLFAFICFIALSNLNIILTKSKNKEENKDYSTSIRISTYSFQTIISIINLTYFKDLFFMIGSFIIELGVLIDKNKDETSEIITLIICIIFLLLSSGFTVYRYKYEVIGISKEDKKNEINDLK